MRIMHVVRGNDVLNSARALPRRALGVRALRRSRVDSCMPDVTVLSYLTPPLWPIHFAVKAWAVPFPPK